MSYLSHKQFEDKQDRDPQGARSFYNSRVRNVNEKQEVFAFPLEIELNAQYLLSLMSKTDDSRRVIEDLGMTLDDCESTPYHKRKSSGTIERRKRKKKQPPQDHHQEHQDVLLEDICDKTDGELLRGGTPATNSTTKELSSCGSSFVPPENSYSFPTEENKSHDDHESFRWQEQRSSSRPKQSRPPSIIEFPVFDSSNPPVGGAALHLEPAVRRSEQSVGDDDEVLDEQIWQPLPITYCGRSGLHQPLDVPKTPSYLKMAGELFNLCSE